MKIVSIGNIRIGGGAPFVLIAGPCVIESEELVFRTASYVKGLCDKLNISYIFKSSYDKANRTSISSFRGPGIERGLEILSRLKDKLGIPVLSDVHLPEEASMAAEVLDVLQIPAFLCRQTDLVLAVARTGKPVNVKKGQFLSPYDVKYIVEKIESEGNYQILLTERGTTFGYNNLVVDFRSLPIMRETGYPVVFDATHSVQLPGGLKGASGGDRRFVPYLARAAVSVGVDALFMEVHPDPDRALSDGPNMIPLESLEGLLKQLKEIDALVKGI
ncbi:MAG: 3-deoxy-8-phosphooctulonate synthase [Synergistetes bacterium]|nr:3-deoxy-8-phosphooctulonate synthase [Synergistota bacterium]MCX8128329.1 3-deoxy-8-phosphooctulonate synthase [Synergistota bacterium]MDW8192648.1 3-deoxy-8-phosphooctulonate synthase [Synergistota bacterium]